MYWQLSILEQSIIMKVLLSRGNEHKSRFIKREECTSESMKEVELQLKEEEGET